MKEYHVMMTDEAVMDIESIHKYITEELLNPDAANRIYNALLDGAMSLKELPERIKLIDTNSEYERDLRGLVVESYVIIFDIRDDIVNIISIFYGASDINGKLRGRLD